MEKFKECHIQELTAINPLSYLFPFFFYMHFSIIIVPNPLENLIIEIIKAYVLLLCFIKE